MGRGRWHHGRVQVDPGRAKAVVRRRLIAARDTLGGRDSAAAALSDHLLAQPWADSTTVAAYVPVGSEPGSRDLLDRLRDRGVRVLLPVVTGRELHWVTYAGELRPGPWDLLEPVGPALAPDALAAADAVLVPALAVDRHGTRLGRGAGFYDRALPHVRPDTPLIALLHDGELLTETLPAEPHDIPMTHAVTPVQGLVHLDGAAHR